LIQWQDTRRGMIVLKKSGSIRSSDTSARSWTALLWLRGRRRAEAAQTHRSMGELSRAPGTAARRCQRVSWGTGLANRLTKRAQLLVSTRPARAP